MSLLFNMLFRFVIAFLPKLKHLLISWLWSPFAVLLEPKKIKICHSFHFFPFYFHKVMGLDTMIFFECWVLSQLFHSPRTFIKRLISSSLLFSVRVVSSAHLKLLIFLLAILISACDSSSLAFHMIYSTYKLNKKGDIIQPCFTLFPIVKKISFFMFGSNCCFLIFIQVSQETGEVLWHSHLFKNFPQSLWSTQSKVWEKSMKQK